ncbi:T9SS type A sorting domain-containing protein [Chryseobacterium indologenes]|uniref:T9SS type A sorting domain-containing protein n=1 Tax=Chryseobacterium indologenes TaxID=253 RepID=UPI0023E8B1CE|nr:T9SS type A sorting domain-containing protein [Chryseobacterium indologenes]WET48120.1 T9SS type A sorting domain-containing protein [Chryseobacterium indologenes]
MKRLIVIVLFLLFYLAKSQALPPFTPTPFASSQCNNLMGNYNNQWKPSHGSPNVIDLGCGNKVVRLYSKNENINTRKSEGVFIDLNNLGVTIDPSKKYKIIVSYRYSLPQNPNRAINFDVYLANGMTEKSNSNCDEETFPNVSDKLKILTFNNGEVLQDTYTCQVKFKEQGQISPNKSYKYLWITSNLNTTLNFKEYVDIDKIEMYFDNTGGGNSNVCVLPRPTNLQLTNLTSESATISWSPVAGAQKYRVRYYLRDTQDYHNFETSGLSFTFNSLFSGIAYQADVSPICASGRIDGDHVAYIKFNTPSCAVDLIINSPIVTDQNLKSINSISASSKIEDNLLVNFSAGNQVSLLPGFQVKATTGSLFRSYLQACSNGTVPFAGVQKNVDSIDWKNEQELIPNLKINKLSTVKNKESMGLISEVEIYPNPASTYFDINSGREKMVSWEMYDLSGKMVQKGNTNKVDVRSIPDASYLLNIIFEDRKVSRKIIVKH